MMFVRYFLVACIGLCMLAINATPQTVARPPAGQQQVIDGSNETWTIPDRNRINEGTVTVITAPVGGATAIFGSDMARVLDDDATVRVLPVIGKGPVATSSISSISRASTWER